VLRLPSPYCRLVQLLRGCVLPAGYHYFYSFFGFSRCSYQQTSCFFRSGWKSNPTRELNTQKNPELLSVVRRDELSFFKPTLAYLDFRGNHPIMMGSSVTVCKTPFLSVFLLLLGLLMFGTRMNTSKTTVSTLPATL
jgi:hypothetical protein